MASLASKESRLAELLRGYGSLGVAWSGGVDSTLLAAYAAQVLGPAQVLLLNARSPSFPADEAAFVEAFAQAQGLQLRVVHTEEVDITAYAENTPTRCYFCKTEMYDKLWPPCRAEGYAVLADGANADDRGDYRPGQRAAAEQQVVHPLMEAELGKEEIRALSERLALPTWDKPAAACLASRFPYGERIDRDKLQRVEAAEAFLRRRGFRVFRCRSHGKLCRLEFGEDELPRAFAEREALKAHLHQLGYTYVTLDLDGFRSGSMNAVLQS